MLMLMLMRCDVDVDRMLMLCDVMGCDVDGIGCDAMLMHGIADCEMTLKRTVI